MRAITLLARPIENLYRSYRLSKCVTFSPEIVAQLKGSELFKTRLQAALLKCIVSYPDAFPKPKDIISINIEAITATKTLNINKNDLTAVKVTIRSRTDTFTDSVLIERPF